MQRPFYLMAKPSAAHCNMRCSYCFYVGKTASNSLSMSDEVLERYIAAYIAHNPQREISFIWQGGEPTLCGLEFFKKAVALQQRYAGGKIIHNSLQTNGLIINQAWCDFFKEHNFLIGVSIDGPQELHDRCRLDRGGRGTFDKVVAAIALLQRNGIEFNTLTVVHPHNVAYGAKIYQFLKELGSTQLQFIPLTGIATTVDATAYGQFLIDIFDRWYPQDVGHIFVQHIEQWFMDYAGMQPSLCIFKPYCGDQMIIEQNGDIYSCDHFVDAAHRLGNLLHGDLLSIINTPRQLQFGLGKAQLPDACLACPYLKFCHGGCPKHRTVDGSGTRINQFCTAYRLALDHMLPYFDVMYRRLTSAHELAK